MIFLDTNVIIRYLTWDSPEKARKCEKLFQRVKTGKEELYTTTLVIIEVIWVLEKVYECSKSEIKEYVHNILNTPNIRFDEKDILLAAIGLYELKKIDFIDAYNAVIMSNKNVNVIYSYDTHFDMLHPIERKEP